MVRNWRIGVLALGCLAVTWLALPAVGVSEDRRAAGDRQGADEAAAGEDALDRLLRRFGERAAGLKAQIDAAVDKGVTHLVEAQRSDGSWDCYASNYPMGGTALCALAVKKSLIGLYDGTERELQREIRRLERMVERDRATPVDEARLRYLKRQGAEDLRKRAEWQPRVDRAIDWIRRRYNELKSGTQVTYATGGTGPNFKVYDIGVILMLLEGQYTRRHEERGGQSRVGVAPRDIDREDLAWIREMVQWLQARMTPPEQNDESFEGRGWRYPGPAGDGATVDLSNTQYAVLGLKAASRMGVRIEEARVWRDLVEYLVELQCEDGPKVRRRFQREGPDGLGTSQVSPGGRFVDDHARGWSYLPVRDEHHPATGAMTTAGLASLIVASSELNEIGVLPRDEALQAQLSRSVADGLAWLAHHYMIQANPTDQRGRTSGWHYYYLYGLERAGVLAQTEFIGDNAWYLDGARYLIARQADSGAWNANGRHADEEDLTATLTDTSFAILFLKRATVPVRVPLDLGGPVTTGEEAERDR